MNFDDFLGNKISEKYKNLYPILRLVAYEMDMPSGAMDETNHMASYTQLASSLLRLVKYLIEGLKKPSCRTEIYLSETLLQTTRYNGLVDELIKTESVCAERTIMTVLARMQSSETHLGRLNSIRTISLGYSVPGRRAEHIVRQIYRRMQYLRDMGENCAEDVQLQGLLEKANRIIKRRLAHLELVLKKSKVKCFITIGQGNLSDIMLVMACRNLGIWTKEMMHTSSCVLATDYEYKMVSQGKSNGNFFEENVHAFNCADELCFWSEAEIDYYRKYRWAPYRHVYGLTPRLSIVGCPELLSSHLNMVKALYENKQAITLFVPFFNIFSSKFELNTNEHIEDIYAIRSQIYIELNKVKERLQVPVYIKYHPAEPLPYQKREEELIKSLQYEVMDSTSAAFDRCLCESSIVLGTNSGTLVIALAYDCKVYNIELEATSQFDFCGLDISTVKLEEISMIEVDSTNVKTKVEPFDMNSLLAV